MSQRKAFNFYLSFFEVFEALPNDKEKLAFITAVLHKQFYNEEPNLSGMAKFAYISQQQVINQQVEGWEKKTKLPLARGGLKGGAEGGSVQGEEKGEEKEKGEVQLTVMSPSGELLNWDALLKFINDTTGRSFKTINDKIKKSFRARLKDGYTKEDIFNSVRNAVNMDYHKENQNQYLTPEFFSRSQSLDKYGNETTKVETPVYMPLTNLYD
jgi:uncharacterized phage protein (TIGR02220 family)